ncbi:protoporphyrinogen oxidase [Sanguibacter antarcticus]|uniref:Coproporphyrinogen III oxidase n=1 Tax=Sanguibacter antarcticus TaxID=372484 RepID=A0A2A9E8U1_9MICO|nr:protoporphyrinogen oxidase [Sanguibacter antarcticus]PFG34961.1 oxygen-dependent protoporphyrinogen oxidase [Sanguibacter antarcticus]
MTDVRTGAVPGEDAGSAVRDAVVVGGGVAGLTAAHTLVQHGLHPLVLEASDRCGGYLVPGVLRSGDASVTVDVGAESFAVRSRPVIDLVADLGLETAEPSGRSAWAGGPAGVFPLPATGVLGIPGHPWAPDTRRAIGLVGALRAGADALLPRGWTDTTNLATFVRSRLGSRVLDRLVTPVAGGVHSSDPALLSVDAVAPGLRAAFERTGSLTAAVRALRSQAPAGSAVRGITGGMNRLVGALHDAVAAHGEVRTGTGVESVTAGTGADAGTWVVRTSSGDVVRTRRVVVATTAHDALRILGLGATVELPRGTDIRLVTLLLRTAALDGAPRGTGILVAPGSAAVAKASTHATAKWPWLQDAVDEAFGDGHHVVRLSYGRGGSDPVPASDDALVEQALQDVQALYGVALEHSGLVSSLVTRWDDALPPPTPEHRLQVAALLAETEQLDGLALTGAWVAGTGLAAVVPHAQESATRVTRIHRESTDVA